MKEQILAEEISKREFQVVNRDKMIKHLQEEHKKRGEEILLLKDKLAKCWEALRELKNRVAKDAEKYAPEGNEPIRGLYCRCPRCYCQSEGGK